MKGEKLTKSDKILGLIALISIFALGYNLFEKEVVEFIRELIKYNF